MQTEIQRIQNLYGEWVKLHEKLVAAEQDWQRSQALMRELHDFYFNGKYMQYNEAIENGAEVHIDTQGEYSVMSEDALWNAFHENQQLAWSRLRAAVDVLDPVAEKS